MDQHRAECKHAAHRKQSRRKIMPFTHIQKPLYIFDLDGTLALIQHRRHFVQQSTEHAPASGKFKPNWPAFHAACVDDKPNPPVITLLRSLVALDNDIWIFSGRSDEVKAQTIDWLVRHLDLPMWTAPTLTMREKGDFTPDDVLKRMWYEAMSEKDKARLVCTFDDRDRVVQMWREVGVTCLQVAPGDF
jgi:phosphoserine phosphatase